MEHAARTRKGFAFRIGWCVGALRTAAVANTRNSAAQGRDLGELRSDLLRDLLELRDSTGKNESETDTENRAERILKGAEEIRRIILDNGLKGIRENVLIGRITQIAGIHDWKPDERTLRKVRCSVEKFGLKNPPVVRRSNGKFELVSGRLRFEACRRLNMKEIPVVIKDVGRSEAEELTVLDVLSRNGRSRLEAGAVVPVLRYYIQDAD